MAVQNEIIKLLLQFETAFTSQDTFSDFVKKTTSELNSLDNKIKDSSETFNNLFTVLKAGATGSFPLKEAFTDLSKIAETKGIVENTKILKQSIESLQQILDKKLNITNLEASLAKIQEKFIPSKGIGAEKSADFAGKFLKTIEEQFKSFASGSMDLKTFFDNLFPKDITAKSTTEKIKTELVNLKSEVEKGITDLTNLTTEKRVEVLEFISKKILADSTKLSVAANAVKGDGKQLVDAIVSMAASLQDIGFLPPKDFFPNFAQGLKEQGAIQKDIIRNVLKDLMAQFNVAGFELEKSDIAFKLLERLGFNKSTLEAQFKELNSTAQKEFEKFNSNIRQAIESPKTLNLDTYVREFQGFMSNAFKNNALVSFGDEFQAQFKKVSTELNGFTRTATQSLSEVNNFEQGIKALINALDSGKGAGTPAALALKELLETYLQVEKQFRFDQVLKTQEQAISEFDKKFKELTNTLKNNQPPEYTLKLVTKSGAGDEAFKEREAALATYNALLKQTTDELDRTARSIAHLESIQKSTTATEDQKTSLNNLIDRYKTYQQSLSDEANILRKNQADWDATWLRKTQNLSLAEERVKNFFKVLNQSSDAGTITGTTGYLKGLLDIGVKSTESAKALESAFQIFSNFGGVTKESLQYLQLFEKAISSLFKSMGQGEGKVTLIDLSGLKTQADGTVVATETLRNQLIKLAGSSKEAQENFQNLAFANDFLAKTQGAADTAFGKQISALFSLAQAAKLYVNNIENLILKNDLYEQNLRKVQAAELEVRESFKKVQDSPQDPSAVNALTQAYQKYTREIAAAELRLKELKNLQTELATQKNTFGFTEAGQQLPGLEAGIRSTTALIEQLKNKILDLRTSGGGSKIFEDIIKGVEQGNQQLKSSFDALERDLSGRLLAITEKLNTNLSKGSIGKGLFDQIQGEINNLSIALKTVNVDGALQAIQALVAKIQTALDPKNVPVNKELAQTYLAPIKELLSGLEVAQGAIARIIPKLDEGQKGKAEELLKNVQTQIVATNTALNDFGKTANTAQLSTRFEEAKVKAQALNAEISQLGKGSFDQTKYNDFELRLKDIRKEFAEISKENKSFGTGLGINELNNLLITAKGSLSEFGKATNFETLSNQLITLRDKFPTLNADIANFDTLLREAFAGTKTAIDVKPLTNLKNEIEQVKNSLKDQGEKTLYASLLYQLDQLINKTTIYNATVKAGASKADVGIKAFIDPAAVNASKASLQALETELNNNKIALDTFVRSSGQTKESATQIAENFKVTGNSVKNLTAEIGLLSGVSSSLLSHINALKASGQDTSILEGFRASIEATIKTKKDLDAQFRGGNLTGKLKEDLDRLVDVKDALAKFKTVGDSFKSAAFFDSTSYSARLAYEEIQRLENAMRKISGDINKSLSVGRTEPINPAIKTELVAQQKLADDAIVKLQQIGQVYDQLRSKPKIEIFEKLRNTFENITGNGRTELRAYQGAFDNVVSGVKSSIASLTGSVEPLNQTLINSFKQQSETIASTSEQYKAWINLLKGMGQLGQTKFKFADGSEIGIGRLIVIFQDLLDKANAVKAPIEQASNELKDKLGTAAGQAELRISNLITKFTQLQDRINTLNPGSSINEIYGSVKELMMLLDKPYKTGPFFTLPKEGFAPIRNELQSILEVAKNVQTGLQFNLTALTPGTTKYQDTEKAIKTAREEVERLTAASQKLAEYEKGASHFSALRGNLHGASTTLQELAHEGAFIYKGLEALFKNLAKNLSGPVVTINTASVNQQLDQLTTKFGVTGTAADHLKTQVKEALNQQLGGGGLAAAEQYQKAFQQLEEAFVKFRSGLTQAAMGFQMLGDSLLEPFKKAKEGFEQFSDTMGVVSAVTNATQAQFKALTDQALLMGATTRFTAEQAAEGLKALAKAGFTAEEQLASLPIVMRLAQAAATDLATAASISTVVMKQFRMDPDQFNEAADKLTLAANRTLGTVEDLGFAFKYVGALASNIGADFGDLTAAVGLLQNAGLKGTLAGTALRGMLMALYNPTRDETKLIAELGERIGGLGLQISDASGKFVGYGKIVKQLEQAGITTGEVLRFFGQRAGPGMAALLAQGSEALQNLEGDLRNAEGTTAHMAEIMEQTLKGRLLLMRSAFEALSDSIGHNLAPTLAAAANVMADFVSRFVAIRQEFPALATAVDHVLAGFALFASVLGGLAVTFAFIIVPVRQFMGFLKTLIVTTLAGAGAITSLSAAQAFNAKVTAATMVAVEAEFRARIAQAAATGVATTATTYNTIAAGINVVAIREQTAALLGATAAAGANAAAQGSLWVGLKNVILGLGKNLLNIGGMLRFAFLSPLGLVLTAITGVVAYTLLHEKSVAQTNVELDKQSQIIEYSRKNIIKLNEELLSSAEQLKRNQQALNDLRSGVGPERNLLGQKDQSQTTEANLQLDIDKGKKEIQKQLKELFTQITESATYKDLVNFKIEFDAGGAFKQFTTVLKDGNKEFEILGNNLEFNTDKLKDFTKALDETALARQRSNAEEKIANELSKITQEKLSKENFGQLGSQFRNPFAFDTDFEESTRRISSLTKSIKHYSDQIEKLKKGASLKDVGFSLTTLDLFKTPSNEEAIKRLEDLRIGLNDELAKLNVTTNSQVGEFVDYFVKTVPEMLGKGLDEIAVQNADNPEIIKNILNGIFNLRNFDRAAFDPVYNAIQAELNERNKSLTTEQLVGENLKKPVIGLVNATKDLVTYLEATNKELKKKIDEQKKIFDEAKVVVDAVKAYQTAIAAAAKEMLDLKNQEIEFEAKVKLENLDQDFERQIRELENENRIIDLPFKAKILTDTTDTSGFKALSSLSGLLLDYERKNTTQFIQLQIANSQAQVDIKRDELDKKQRAAEDFVKTAEFLYNKDTTDYLKAQQEQAKGVQEALDAKYEAVQNHLKNLLKLYEDNAKAIIDLEKQKKQFEASIEQTRVKFGDAQLLPTEQLQKAKADLVGIDAAIKEAVGNQNFEGAIVFLQERQKLVDQIATSAGAQPELTLKVANLAENLEFDLDRIDFEKEFNKANIRITTGAQGLGEAFNSTFTKFKPLSSSFVPQLESGAVDVKKALQTVVRVYSEEVDNLKKKDAEGFQGLGEGLSTLQYASAGILKSFGKSFDDNLRFKKAQNELENFGDMMEDAFNVRPVTDLVKGVDDLDARLSQVTQAQNALNEFGIPGESTSAVPLLSNISETGEKGIVTLRNVKGEMIALSLQAQTKIKPLEGLTTDIQKSEEALVGFKSLIDTQIEDLSRNDKVVELPISFKADFNAFDTASLGKYSAEVLSYEKNLNKEVLDLQLKRINASLDEEKKAAEQKKTVVENQINIVTSQYNQQLGAMQNWSKQDLDAYKSNIESKKSSLISFLQEELSATQATYNELFQIRANLLNKNKALDEQYISFQANATKNLQTIDDLGKSDSQKTYETRLKSLNLQADADAALAQGDYDRAKALLEQRQQLIDAAVSSLKPEDTIGKFFLKQDQTEAVASYKKVTDALKLQNQSAIKDVEAQLNSVNGQILALKQSADTAKAALQDLLNKLFELSNKKFQAEVEFVSNETQKSADIGTTVFGGAKDQRVEQQNVLNNSIKITRAEQQALIKTYKEQGAIINDLIGAIRDKQLIKIGIDDQSYKELLEYATFYEAMVEQLNREGLEIQVKKTGLAELKKQYEELSKLKKVREEYAAVEKQLEQATAGQANLTALVGFSNTLNTATGYAKELNDVLSKVKGPELGNEETTAVNKQIENLRTSAQALREDFKKVDVPEFLKERLEAVINLLQKDASGLKGEELKGYIRDVTQALKDLEGHQRDAGLRVAEQAKSTLLDTVDVVQASLLEIQRLEKDTEIKPEVKDITLLELRKRIEDSLSKVQLIVKEADDSKDPKRIAALAPVKTLLEKMNSITKSNVSDEEKITQLLEIRNGVLQKGVTYSQEEMESRRRNSEFLAKMLGDHTAHVNGLKSAQNAQQSIASSADDMTQAWQAWLAATPDQQLNALDAITKEIEKIKETGLSLAKPGDEKAVNDLFGKLTQAQEKFQAAQDKLQSAFTSGDATAINEAIKGIRELGTEFANAEGLSKEARQEFAKLAKIPSLDMAIRFNPTVIPELKKGIQEVQDQAQQRTPVNMEWSEVLLAVEKLKVVESEITKLKGLSAVEFKGYTTVDVDKGKEKLAEFAQRAKELLEIPVEAQGDDFKIKLRDLFVEYEQFRSHLQPIKIEGDTKNLDTQVYKKIIRILQEAKSLSQDIGNDKTTEEYNVLLNKILQAKGKISSDKLSIQMEGHQELQQLIEDTAALRNELSQSEKDSIIVKATMVGREDVTSGLTFIENAIDVTKNKTRSLNEVLKELRGSLAETTNVPGLETPASQFDELNKKLKDTQIRFKEAFSKGNLNEESIKTFEGSIQAVIDKMSQVKGVSSEMVTALRSAVGIEIQNLIKPEAVKELENIPSQLEALEDQKPTVSVNAEVKNQEAVTNLQNQVSWLTENPFITTITALADEAINSVVTLSDYLYRLPPLKTIEIHTRYTSSGGSSNSSTPVQSENQGGLIGSLQYLADGGLAKFKEMASAFVPGSGNTDTVPAMLTPGEFVVKKERVKSLGIGFLNALNSGLLQFKSAGGMIYNSPINTLNKMSDYVKPNYQIPQQAQSAGGPPIDINLTIKDKTFNIKTPRSEAGKLVSALQYLERGIK